MKTKMIKHIIKMIWNQRKSNSWLFGELLLVSVCLWYVVDYFLVILYTFNAPVGFDISHTYRFIFNAREEGAEGFLSGEAHPATAGEDLWEAVERIRRQPEVEVVAISRLAVPYNTMDNFVSFRSDTVSEGVLCRIGYVTPEYFDVYRISPAQANLKEGVTGRSVVLTADVTDRLFQGKDAVRQPVYMDGDVPAMAVGGVCGRLRASEFKKVRPTAFLFDDEASLKSVMPGALPWVEVSVRVKPEADTGFAETFLREKSNQVEVGNLYLQNIIPLENIREDALREGKGEMKMRLSILFFLLTNIFLGIVGIFWFRTRRRQGEMGLRMALGATRSRLKAIVWGEGILLLTFAFVPALLICINIALLDLTSSGLLENTFLRFAAGIMLTYLLIALMILIGIWYPATEASRLEPAEALHYE